VHAAADTEYDWAWYGGLVGAYFASHPAQQQATVKVEDRSNVSTSHLPERWARTDEWYNYRANPRSRVKVLASLDESSYSGGTMNGDHPITWCQNYSGRPETGYSAIFDGTQASQNRWRMAGPGGFTLVDSYTFTGPGVTNPSLEL
jgi:type 1 glutamine amidotransferase